MVKRSEPHAERDGVKNCASQSSSSNRAVSCPTVGLTHVLMSPASVVVAAAAALLDAASVSLSQRSDTSA